MRRVITTTLKASLATLLLGGGSTAFAGGPSSFPSALPPVANPGECYAQVKIPAQYSTGSETVKTADGFQNLEVTEAQFQRRTENVMTKEPSTRYEVRQPSYRSVSERILTRPAHERLSVSAPQFSTVTENIQTSASHLVWKRGNPGELQRQGYIIHSTADGRLRAPSGSGGYQGGSYASTQSGGDACGPGCEIWCLVEEPGASVTTQRRALTAPPRITRTPVPPEFKTITKQVVSDPGGVREIPIPAEYSSVEVQDLVRPAEAYEVGVPPVMGQVETKVLVSPERYEWRRVLCQPGTGSIRSSQSYQSGGHTAPSTSYSSSHLSGSTYSGGSAYSSGTAYSGGTSYSSEAVPTGELTYSDGTPYVPGAGYSGGSTHSSGTTYSGDTSAGTQPSGASWYDPETGYYGTEDYPAYERRGPNRDRR